MRELKFRVWDNVDYMATGFTFQHIIDSTIQFTPECIVMQFIGLKDKNGKEIYDGDLMVDYYPVDEEDLSKGYNESYLPVVWSDKKLKWCVDASFSKDGSFLTSLVKYFGEFLEVKGNIYQNPELIQRTNQPSE